MDCTSAKRRYLSITVDVSIVSAKKIKIVGKRLELIPFVQCLYRVMAICIENTD